MAQPPVKLHMGSQQAHALLDPIRHALNRQEALLQNYLDRLTLSEADTDHLVAARAAIAQAATAIKKIEEAARA